MAPITLSQIDEDLKDVIQNFFEIQSAVHGYLGPETQQELVKKLFVDLFSPPPLGPFHPTQASQTNLLGPPEKSLTVSLQTLSAHAAPAPSYVQSPPSRTGLSPADPPVQSIQLPPEIIDYVDAARNPDIYTREFVELVQKSNQELKGKMEAFASFRDVLAKEMASAMPECKKEVERVVKATGGSVDAGGTTDLAAHAGHWGWGEFYHCDPATRWSHVGWKAMVPLWRMRYTRTLAERFAYMRAHIYIFYSQTTFSGHYF
uniref:Mediator of RNA polymerase II transcription subunit 10 n=1 Tax=Coccidioides posadasii RMSCC 3488 TaxID=454284 RepID=A0A0J6FS44_COCPO|nr:hypothetical protein CPAG_09477 [Coccidioides posadasii RMSCC 3488]